VQTRQSLVIFFYLKYLNYFYYMNFSQICLVLAKNFDLTYHKLQIILKNYDQDLVAAAKDAFQKIPTSKFSWMKKLKQLNYQKIESDLEKIQTELEILQIYFITIFDTSYPQVFHNLSDAPVVIFWQGNWQILQEHIWLSVVGSRNVATYAKTCLQKLLPEILDLKVGIVSGLALGVDSLGHRLALENQTKTIAVLGSGLDNASFYPQQNLSLKHEILATGGLVLTEFFPKTLPQKYNFPRRNRLIAALGQVTFIEPIQLLTPC